MSDRADALRACQLIVTATVGAGNLVQPHHLSEGPVVVCDISVPSDIATSVAAERPDVLVIPGGIVRLARTTATSCWAGPTAHGSYGATTPEGAHSVLALADKHGFVLYDIEEHKQEAVAWKA